MRTIEGGWTTYGRRARRRLEDRLRVVAWQWVAIVVASVAGALLFAKIGEDVVGQESGVVDLPIRAWVLAHQNGVAFDLFLAVTRVGSAVTMVVLALVVAAWLWRWRGRRIAAALVLAPAVATTVFDTTKHLVARRRPPGALRLHELTYAFPSGHATTATAVLVTLAYVLARERMVGRGTALAIGIVGPLLVGVSRVYLDVHWATDVAGGWAVGLFVATLGAGLYEELRRRTAGAVPRTGDRRAA